MKPQSDSHVIEYERMILGGILLDNAILDEVHLTAEDFYRTSHRRIYQSIRAVVDQGLTADLETVASRIAEGDTSVPMSYIAQLTDSVPSSANIDFYVQAVHTASMRRRLRLLGQQVVEWSDSKEPDETLDSLETEMTNLLAGDDRDLKPVRDYTMAAIEQIEAAYKSGGAYSGIPSGYQALDQATAGFQNGDLVILAARPSIGKTTLALNMAVNMARRYGKRVAFFSCEMAGKILAMRLLAAEGRIGLYDLRTGKLKPTDFHKLTEAASRIYEAPLYIDDTPNIALSALRSRARKAKRKGVDVLFVDYLTLIKHGDTRMPRHERVGEIAKGLKQLARELDLPVIAL